MSLVTLDGQGFWLPVIPGHNIISPLHTAGTLFTLDADEEEGQVIGTVTIAGGGSKTFGLSSKIGWFLAGPATFATGATLRIGLKHASKIDTAAGPPARATIGAAAFDVSKALVGGTDTLTANTWRDETMADGTPFTVSQGDLVALCFHLDVASGTPSLLVRGNGVTTGFMGLAASTFVTAGPTYTTVNHLPNMLLTFEDGSLGWFDATRVHSVIDATGGGVGSGNCFANLVQLPVPCQIDAVAALVFTSATADFALEVLATPLGTPTALATLPCDANVLAATGSRLTMKALPTPITLAAQTLYAIGVRQATSNAITLGQYEVADASHFKPNGFPGTCYAATSTAGAAFVAQQSQRRRYLIYMRICALDDGTGGASGGGGAVFGGAGGVVS